MENIYRTISGVEYHWRYNGSSKGSSSDSRIGMVYSRFVAKDGTSEGYQPSFNSRMTEREFRQFLRRVAKL